MVQLIVGCKGKGKTKLLLDKVNADIKTASGNIVYLDKSAKHMYELNNKVRLIELNKGFLKNTDQFLGFVAGILSRDHDIEKVFFDSFLKISELGDSDITDCVKRLVEYGEMFSVDFILSVSMEAADLPEELKQYVLVAL